jgi:molybdenum cofactor cytidylyltransferase
MGQLKALLPWHGQPLLAYQIAQLLAAPVERLIVVVGHRAAELAPYLDQDERLHVVENQDYHAGKVSSIICGVAAAPADHHLLVLGVDQPRPAALLAAVATVHRAGDSPITIAGCGGRRGHPVLFRPELRPELLAITEETAGLRAVLRRHQALTVDTGDPLALVNLNTPEDYAAALLLSSTSSARAGNQ